MKYEITTFPINDLISLIESNKLDLKPYYQRNDIWSKDDQQDLIESIMKGYPLPSFFIYKKDNGEYEMVDGQQRSRTIYRFFSNQIKYRDNILFVDIDRNRFANYLLSITLITDVSTSKELEEFYVLVNKKGKHLTKPELFKAEFANTIFLKLVEEISQYQELINLNLFTESSKTRMNDRDFIEELAAYIMYGVQDKKTIVEFIYKKDISEIEKNEIEKNFKQIIKRINVLNEIFPISKTRFKQRNDFYTLFNFIHLNLDESIDVLVEQYATLLLISPHISPSIENCPPLREYAINCVSQSNSKKARESRLSFLNNILKNSSNDLTKNKELAQVVDFIEENQLFNLDFKQINNYYLIQSI